jgi:hypothetical protein
MQIEAFQISSGGESITIERTDIGKLVTINISDILNFMMQGEVTLIAWDIDEEMSQVFKKLSKNQCIDLQKTNKCIYKQYKLFYIASKLFSLSLSNMPETSQFTPHNAYHLEQYFPYDDKPKTLQQVKYKATELLDALKQMGFQSNKLSSAVSIYESCVLNHISLPTLASSNIPKEAAKFAYLCSGKLWIEAFQIGFFQNCWDYDINSAFPSIAKSLVDTTKATWINDKNYHAEATYGFCECYVTIFPYVTVSPIIYTNSKGELSTPTGTWKTFLCKCEIDFIHKWQIGEVEILSGWWCICKNINKRPLENVGNRLLAFKQSKNETIRLLAKRMSVGGLYGKFGEEHKNSFGKHFNPVFFSYISALCRLEVAKFIYEHKLMENLIHVSVDGVLVNKEVTL